MSTALWQHEHPLGDRFISKTRKTDHMETVIELGEAASTVMRLEVHMKWVQQTIHQAHHSNHMGYWWECPKDTCKSTAELLRELEERP